MPFPLLIGFLILFVVTYFFLRILKPLFITIVLIAIIMFSSFLIFGSIQDLRNIPIIGKVFPKIPTSTGEAIGMIKDVFYNLEILGVERSHEGNVLITVANTGKLSVSGFEIFVENTKVKIINNPKDPLPSKETTVIEVDWKKDFSKIVVNTRETRCEYTTKK